MWVYNAFQEGVFTVGFYNASGAWIAITDFHTEEEAIQRVHYLNGGGLDTTEVKENKIDADFQKKENPPLKPTTKVKKKESLPWEGTERFKK